MKLHLVKIALLALVAFATFLPYSQMLIFLTYSPLSEEQALEQAPTIRLKQTAKMYVHGKERSVAAGTNVKLMGIQQYVESESPRTITPNRYYSIRLDDGTKGCANLPFIAEDQALVDSLYINSKKVQVYLPETVVLRPLSTVDSIIDSKAKPDDGWFKKLSRKVRKGHSRAIRITYKMMPKVVNGGYALYPKYSFWNEYSLPAWLRCSGWFGIIFAFIMWLVTNLLFWPVVFWLAKDVAVLPYYLRPLGNNEAGGFAWIIFLALCIPLMLFGLNSFFAWIFFLMALFALFHATIQNEDHFRCVKCHCRDCNVEEIGRHYSGSKTEEITTTWGDGDKQVEHEKSSTKTTRYKVTCPECGHVREYSEKDTISSRYVVKRARRHYK